MIVTDRRSPQHALADALGGRILGPSTILVGARLVVAGPTGVVRVDGVRVGRWSDDTAVLAAAYRVAVES